MLASHTVPKYFHVFIPLRFKCSGRVRQLNNIHSSQAFNVQRQFQGVCSTFSSRIAYFNCRRFCSQVPLLMTAMQINTTPISCISAEVAAQMDAELLSDVYGYSVDQLMELAGFSVAEAFHASGLRAKNILVICGPGNNGGDGLVAARHLKQRSTEDNCNTVTVLYPKRSQKSPFAALYVRLVRQLEHEGVRVVETMDDFPLSVSTCDDKEASKDAFDLIIDAMFGFGFKGPVRQPFDSLIQWINASSIPVLCVDIPSGWDVALGPVKDQLCIASPSVIVSLMAPKTCMRFLCNTTEVSDHLDRPSSSYSCVHFLGHPNVPRTMQSKYNLRLPTRIGKNEALVVRLH